MVARDSCSCWWRSGKRDERKKKRLREKPIWQREEKEREKTKARSGGCSWWWRLVWWWWLVEEQWRISEKRELWIKEKKNEGEETERRTSWSENAKLIFGERRYVMGQVIRVGPILCLILQKCHWNSIFKKLKTHLVFIFHHPHPKFWVFESWKQWSKTKPNRWSFVEPTRFGWWIMKTKWYHSVFMLSKHALMFSCLDLLLLLCLCVWWYTLKNYPLKGIVLIYLEPKIQYQFPRHTSLYPEGP